ncbi:hypothetical protein WG622_12690 [Cognatishimia sp. D5M38]|uniref:Uncharacterized protein n=1 Tax=Cognatishimia coralii TaxID=3083254 RepID=A0ABU8QI60_9RHOB
MFRSSEETQYQIIDHEHVSGKVFILQSSWQQKFAVMMRQQRISALRVPSPGFGCKAQPLDFIVDLQFLKSVEVYHDGIEDISPLAELSNVEILGLQVSNTRGLSNWRPPLRVLMARWSKHIAPMLSIDTLEYVNIQNYPFENLRHFRTPRLRRLALTSRRLQTLAGVHNLQKLEEVNFYNCPSLGSVTELDELKTMRTLKVAACRQISSKPIEKHFPA